MIVELVGGGTMGAGIAEVCAKAVSGVLVLETKQEFADRDLVIEAGPEIEWLKHKILGMSTMSSSHPTSSRRTPPLSPVIKVAGATLRPEQVVDHFQPGCR